MNQPLSFSDPFGDTAFPLPPLVVPICMANPAACVIAAAGVGVVVAAVAIYCASKKDSETNKKEHTKGARKSTEEKHQKGQSRKQRDGRGEKGDARRPYRR